MSSVFRGRHTAQIEGPFVVFIIGMRINRLWAVHQWLPVARAMGLNRSGPGSPAHLSGCRGAPQRRGAVV
jgi:hypothetical protein